MSEWIKNTSYLVFVLLVTTSALYAFVNDDPVMAARLSVSTDSNFTSTAILSKIQSQKEAFSETALEITTDEETDFPALLGSAQDIFFSILQFVPMLTVGWVALLFNLFASVNLEGLAYVFAVPLGTIQIIAVFYFFRDLATLIPGVG